MEKQLDIFTVIVPEGADCALRKSKDRDGLTEYEFSFVWTEETAAADGTFTVEWTDMVSGIMYKWDSRCALARDLSPHWNDIFTSMISSNSPVAVRASNTGSWYSRIARC